MKVLYFYQYFTTPKGSWGTRAYDFARIWSEKGHKITVVTAVYSKSDLNPRKLIEHREIDGIHVIIIGVRIDNKHPILKRLLAFFVFSLFSVWYALTWPTDLIISSSGPITVGIPGLVGKIIRRRRLVFEVRDLWPEGAIQLGIITNPLMISTSRWFESFCYRMSDLIVTLSPGITEDIKNRFGYQNILTVSNAADLALFGSDREPGRKPFNKVKYAIYTGNIGDVNNSYLLYRTALKLRELARTDIWILLIGDGQRKEELETLKQEQNLENLQFLPLMPKEELVTYQRHAMVSLIPLKNLPVLNSSSPNKLYESMAVGLPVIQNTTGWIKQLLEEEQIGYTVDADDEQDLAERLIFLADNPQRAEEMGSRARQVAEKKFDSKILAEKMLNGLDEIFRHA